MAYEYLICERRDSVETVTLNRPGIRNAFNDTLIRELADWARMIATDTEVRAVVIAGAGPTFCAGADVSWMARTMAFSESENHDDALNTALMFAAIDDLPMAVVGRVHGAAIGGGAGLAAVCDIVVSDEQATFGFSEVKLGIIPAVISPFVIAKIGRSAARELFVTGRRFTAQHAQEIGLVHTVVTAEALDATVAAVVHEVMSAGPEAVAAAKRLVAEVCASDRGDLSEITAAALARRRVSPEGQEGLRAFLEKRKPSWSRG